MLSPTPLGEFVGRRPVLAEQRSEFGAKRVAVGSPDHAGVDRKGGGRVGVAHLVLNVGDIEAGGEHERDVCPSQRVGRDVGDDRGLLAFGA